MLKFYLAGAIRGSQDYQWRKIVADKYQDRLTTFSPSDIGIADAEKLRKFGGSAYMTYRTDLNLIDQADGLIVNLLAMDEGYPSIGTLFEVGYARAKGKLILIHASARIQAHPFIAFGGDGVFLLWNDLFQYLDQYLEVQDGGSPVFRDLVSGRCVR